MKKIHFTSLYALLTVSAVFAAEEYLTPVDFGFRLTDHGYVDLSYHPPGVVMGNFNRDDYPDIARIQGKCLEVYINRCGRYDKTPTYSKYYDRHLINIRCEGEVWIDYWDIIVTRADGTEDRIENRMGQLCIERTEGVFEKYSSPPRQVSEADFQLVWESEARPFGMDVCAVDDIDGDGITELCTWWKQNLTADSAFILIYKNTSDNTYELYMQEQFTTFLSTDLVHYMTTCDIDQNGQKELVFVFDRAYFWEFSQPGIYTKYRSMLSLYGKTGDSEICDFDEDGILEIAFITYSTNSPPPTQYLVWEFDYKAGEIMGLTQITGMYQDWLDSQFAIGDFDNDGILNIVAGNPSGFVGTLPVDISYFTFNPDCTWNFSHHWLHTGLANTCKCPVIEDIDQDGDYELFAAGNVLGASCDFIWEATGFDSGYVAWIDTSDSPAPPLFASFCYLDYIPAIVITKTFVEWPAADTQMEIRSFPSYSGSFSWFSAVLDSIMYYEPHLFYADDDNKLDFVVSESYHNEMHVWEQINAGINLSNENYQPSVFQLYPNYPNPFNSSTQITFYLNKVSDIEIKIYNIEGRFVYSHTANSCIIGKNSLEWDASGLSSGIYFIYLRAENQKSCQKALLLK